MKSKSKKIFKIALHNVYKEGLTQNQILDSKKRTFNLIQSSLEKEDNTYLKEYDQYNKRVKNKTTLKLLYKMGLFLLILLMISSLLFWTGLRSNEENPVINIQAQAKSKIQQLTNLDYEEYSKFYDFLQSNEKNFDEVKSYYQEGLETNKIYYMKRGVEEYNQGKITEYSIYEDWYGGFHKRKSIITQDGQISSLEVHNGDKKLEYKGGEYKILAEYNYSEDYQKSYPAEIQDLNPYNNPFLNSAMSILRSNEENSPTKREYSVVEKDEKKLILIEEFYGDMLNSMTYLNLNNLSP